MKPQNINSGYTTDKNMLKLLNILKASGEIRFDSDFCEAIGLLRQNLVNIKNGKNHFTPEHIENAIKVFEVDANWLFGIGDQIFLGNKKRHIEKKDTFFNNSTV